jgi:hypothetical protein
MVTVTVDEQTAKSIQELADRLQKSREEVVELAIQEKLKREEQDQQAKEELVERLIEIGRTASKYFPEDARAGDITAFLYDERGLPK